MREEGGIYSPHGGPNSWQISWSILSSIDQRTYNSTRPAQCDQTGTTEGAFPGATDVIGLIGHDGGNVGVTGRGDEKDTKILNPSCACIA